MIPSAGGSPATDPDAVRLAVGGAVVSALLSPFEPYLASLTGALGALALAGWVAARTAPGLRWAATLRPWGWVVLVGLAVGACLYLAPPEVWNRFRAVPLAIALVPLWKMPGPRGPA